MQNDEYIKSRQTMIIMIHGDGIGALQEQGGA